MKKILSVILSLILTFTFLNTSILAKEENIPDPKQVLNEGIQVESESSIKEFAKAVDKEQTELNASAKSEIFRVRLTDILSSW